MRKAVNVAVIENNQILLVKKNLTWILPGGKPENEESNKKCLTREINEELSKTNIKILDYFGRFVGEAPHKKDILYADVYFGKLIGKLGKPSKEINDVKFINPYEKYNFSDITQNIIKSLINEGYLYGSE